MNSDEHIRRAEQILAALPVMSSVQMPLRLAEAQIHATLALAVQNQENRVEIHQQASQDEVLFARLQQRLDQVKTSDST